ncbi:MAG: hypothetical protein GEV03_16340 [Streptosporangiales bacterium]|nr:hypothetical protein [Streptosporangiales bacterium]
MPVILFCTTPFVQMARTVTSALGAPGLRIVEIAHPLGGLREADLQQRADAAIQAVRELFATRD